MNTYKRLATVITIAIGQCLIVAGWDAGSSQTHRSLAASIT